MANKNSLRLMKEQALRLMKVLKSGPSRLFSLAKQKKLFFWFLFVLLLVSVLWPKRNLVEEWRKKTKLEGELAQWERLAEQFPGHRDIYLRLAVLNWQLKKDQKAEEYLEKAKNLDPNFEAIKKVEKLIQGD